MQTLEAICTRRSIRKYENKPIDRELIKKLLFAAMHAPSACNQQPWHFIVISERKLLDAIPSFSPLSQMCKEAPVAILICGDTSLEISKGFWTLDCSAAAQNLLLAAHDQGLGAVWSGIYPRKDRMEGFRKMFSLQEEIIPFALIVLGFPAEQPQQVVRFQEHKIHYNSW